MMPRPDGHNAAIFFLCFLLLLALVVLTAITARTNRDFVENVQQKTKTSRAYCDAKVGALGHLKTANSGTPVHQKEQDSLDTLCAAIRQAEAAEDSADYALASLILLFVAAVAAGMAAIYTSHQAKIAETAYRRLERPYLYPIIDQYEFSPWDDSAPWVSYIVANYGKLPATVTSIGETFNDVSDTANVKGRVNEVRHRVIAPGATTPGPTTARLYADGEVAKTVKFSGDNIHRASFILTVIYEDPMGQRYRDAFSFRGNNNPRGFVIESERRETLPAGDR